MTESSQNKIRKRRRRVWACSECRRRKLQCDRTLPSCSRCKRAGQPCQYVDIPGESPSTVSHHSAGSPKADHRIDIGKVTNRVDHLESRLAVLESISSHDVTGDVVAKDGTALWSSNGGYNRAVLAGNNFRTKFRGKTSSGALMDSIPGFKQFTQDAFEAHPILEQIRQHVDQSERVLRPEGEKPFDSPHAALLHVLPSKDETDRRVGLYMQSFDHVYHILHRPTFERDYEKMWTDLKSTDPRHIVIVLLIVAIVHCSILGPSRLFNDSDGTVRDEAAAVYRVCADWLQVNHQKFDHILDFQINFLLLLGRQLNDRRWKRTWANAGHTLRIWMCAGLHCSVDSFGGGTTPLAREMRKRIWAAAAEFELQSAFEHGMGAHSWLNQSDITPPLNIADDLLDPDTGHENTSQHTPSSYLCVAGDSLRFRHTLNTALNCTNSVMSFGQTNEYAERLHTYLRAVPNGSSPEATLVNSLLVIQLSQYLLALYSRQLEHSASVVERQFSRTAVMDAACRMLSCHKAVLEHGSYVVEVLYSDHVRIALAVCHGYVTSDPQTDNLLVMTVEQHAFRAVSDLVSLYSDKVRYHGGDRRHFWLMTAAMGLMHIKKDPAGRAMYVQDAVTNLARPYADSLKLQSQSSSAVAIGEKSSFDLPAYDDTIPVASGHPALSIDDLLAQWCDNMADWDTSDWLYDTNALQTWDAQNVSDT